MTPNIYSLAYEVANRFGWTWAINPDNISFNSNSINLINCCDNIPIDYKDLSEEEINAFKAIAEEAE